jgi:hypothetical protein
MGSRQRISHRGLRDLASLAEKQGWEVTFTHGGHLRWRPPDGDYVITSSTPDTKLSFDRAKIDLKKAGLITTAAELRAHQKSQPDTKGQDVPDPFCCRNVGCRERFESQFLRDRHESDCEHKPALKKVPCPVPDCGKQITEKNLPAHVKTNHVGWGWERGSRTRPGRPIPPAHTPIEPLRAQPDLLPPDPPPPLAPADADNDALIDLMVETVFPQGLPLRNPAVLRALADFSEAANKFLDAAKEAM